MGPVGTRLTGLIDDAAAVLARATTQLSGGSTVAARHLVARAGRDVAAVLDTPLTPVGPNANGLVVLTNALERILTAHGALLRGQLDEARRPLELARFGVDILLPG